MTGTVGGEGDDRLRPTRTQLVVWPLLLIATSYMFFFGGSYFGVYDSRVRMASLVMIAAVLLVWAVAAVRRPRWRPSARLWPAFAISLLVMVVATATSRSARISLDYVAYSAILTALFLLLRQLLAHPFYRPRLLALAVLLSWVLLLGYLLAVGARWVTWWSWVGHFSPPPLRPFYEGLTYGNPGAVAALAVLGVIVAAGHLGFGSRARSAAVLAQALAAAIVVFITASRASWVAVAGTIAIFSVIVLALPSTRARLRRSLADRKAQAVVAAAALVLLGAGAVVGPRVVDRFLNGGTEGERASFVVVAAREFAGSPVTGVGPGMWVANRISATTAGESDYYIPHAHNLPAQIAAEYGVVGIAASLLVGWLVVRLLLRAWRSTNPVRRRWAWAAAAALVYLGIHQLFDLFINMPTVLFLLAIPLAAVDAADEEGPLVALPSRARQVLAASAVLGLVAAMGWSMWAQQSALKETDAVDATDGGSWTSALPTLAAAAAQDPDMPTIRFSLGLAASRSDAAEALTALQKVAGSDNLPTAWLDVAALKQAAGDATGARSALDEALRVGRQQAAVCFAAGWLYEQLGDTATADHWYTAALVLEPRLSRDPFWSDPSRALRWPAIRDAALAQLAPNTQVDFWLSANDTGQANMALGQIAISDQGSLPLVIAAWNGDDASRSAVYAYTSAHPMDLVAITYSARLAARAKDYDLAQRYRDWADLVWGASGASGAEVAVAAPGEAAEHITGINSVAWGIYTYLRSTPRDQLVPGLPRLYLTQ